MSPESIVVAYFYRPKADQPTQDLSSRSGRRLRVLLTAG
jgi:hypothetical protein